MDERPRPVRILIADDHPILREGLKKLLEAEPGFSVVGEAADGEVAVELAAKVDADVLLLDLAMPCSMGMDGQGTMSDDGHTMTGTYLGNMAGMMSGGMMNQTQSCGSAMNNGQFTLTR